MTKILFLLLIFSLADSHGDTNIVQYSYNKKLSIGENEKNLGILLSQGCNDFDFKMLKLEKKPDNFEIIKSYPIELLFKYYKESYSNICFYNFSRLTRFLIPSYKNKVTKIYLESVNNCLNSKENKVSKNCLKKRDAFYVDTQENLGLICNKPAYNLARKLSCHYQNFKVSACKELKHKKHQTCPEFVNHQLEIDSMKLKFTRFCSSISWKKPRC